MYILTPLRASELLFYIFKVIKCSGAANKPIKYFGPAIYPACKKLFDKFFPKLDVQILDKTQANRVENIELIYIQRSIGYSFGTSLTSQDVCGIIKSIKETSDRDHIFLVDNCYSEFVCEDELIDYGADIVFGGLGKNPGAGLLGSGSYIIGKFEYLNQVAFELIKKKNCDSKNGNLKDIGLDNISNSRYDKDNNSNLDYKTFDFRNFDDFKMTRKVEQALQYAPIVAKEAIKCMEYLCERATLLGFDCHPKLGQIRGDVVQAIKWDENLGLEKTRELSIAFCRGLQKKLKTDNKAIPEPAPYPGLDCDVVQAWGGYVVGSTMELSADAPMVPPYGIWVQGGINFSQAKLAIDSALNEVLKILRS